MEHEYIHEQHTVHLVIYHIIWCPKRRRKVLVGPVHDRLKQIIEEVDLRKEFPHLLRMPSLWTRSAFYSTAGHVSSEIIQKYIEKQSTE